MTNHAAPPLRSAGASLPLTKNPTWERVLNDPAYSAFWLLRIGFVVLPLWMGIDKFVNSLTYWPDYLAPWIVDLLPFSAQTAMYVVGAIEIVAAIAIALKPRYASYVVSLWLAGIIINLLTYSGFYDVALRDFGLLVAALTLTRLSVSYDPSPFGSRHEQPPSTGGTADAA